MTGDEHRSSFSCSCGHLPSLLAQSSLTPPSADALLLPGGRSAANRVWGCGKKSGRAAFLLFWLRPAQQTHEARPPRPNSATAMTPTASVSTVSNAADKRQSRRRRSRERRKKGERRKIEEKDEWRWTR